MDAEHPMQHRDYQGERDPVKEGEVRHWHVA